MCLFWSLNNETLNNHVRKHYKMGLTCSADGFTMASMAAMKAHMEAEHGYEGKRHAQAKKQKPVSKHNVALIVPGGYCSHVTLRSWHVRSLGTSRRNNRISNFPPQQRKDGTPLCQARLEVGKKKGWLIW